MDRPAGALGALAAAVVAALVGFGGTVALLVEAGRALGASGPEIASWVTAVCIGIALSSAGLSVSSRVPVITAWSTPGAALIAASAAGTSYPAAIGCFVVAGAAATLVGLIRPLGDLATRIPRSIAAAMLAGVLLPFGLAVFANAAVDPVAVGLLLAVYLVARALLPAAASPLVLAAGIGLIAARGTLDAGAIALAPPVLVFVAPAFERASLVGLALPLFLVTLVGQNLPGLAVIRAAGYAPPARAALTATGALTMALAPFGAHGINLAAITAAICTGPDAHPDPARRWIAGVFYGGCYVVLASLAGPLVALFAAVPRPVLGTIAGLALLGPFAQALAGALGGPEKHREAAIVTLLAAASGVTLLGVGAAFWGLVLGLAALGLRAVLDRRRGPSGADGTADAPGG